MTRPKGNKFVDTGTTIYETPPKSDEPKNKSKTQKEITVVDIWRRSGKSSAKNETDALLEAIVDKIGLK